jgi:hypothetical protein
MPKLSGKEIISDNTEKLIRRFYLIASVTILVKAYNVPLSDIKFFNIDLPPALIDIVLFSLVIFFTYSFIISWIGDLLGYRLWFDANSITSEFGSEFKLDKTFLRGSIPLILDLYKKSINDTSIPEEQLQRNLKDFTTNYELYIIRLEYAGRKFNGLNLFAKFYIWIQSFLIPLCLSIIAIYLVVKYGAFTLPINY